MKDIRALFAQTPATPIQGCFAPAHDFNVEGMIANNFGHGDDCEPIDPMRDSRITGILPGPRQTQSAQADYRSAGGR